MHKLLYSKNTVLCWLFSEQLQAWILDNHSRENAAKILQALPLLAEDFDPESSSDRSIDIPGNSRQLISLSIDRSSLKLIVSVPWKKFRFTSECPYSLPCYLSGEKIPGIPSLKTMLRWRKMDNPATKILDLA